MLFLLGYNLKVVIHWEEGLAFSGRRGAGGNKNWLGDRFSRWGDERIFGW